MIGQLFDGKYRILKELGHGGMGKVYLAENIRLGNYWAIKEVVQRPGEKIDLMAEPNILRKLAHPSLPRIFDIIEDDDHLYVIVDYIEGRSLDVLLEESGKFPESTVVQWGIELCGVLSYLHEFKPNPIIYRDMKPSNIMLAKDGSLKLIDFGIAREYKKESESDTIYIGTRGYAAPEQYGSGQTDATTDIYSLGVTLYHLLTGRSPNQPPYEIRPVREYEPHLSKDIERIILRCVKPDPSDRYQTARHLMEELKNIHNQDGIHDTGKLPADEGAGFPGKNRCFKKLVLTVWDHAEFGCELAYVAAKYSGLNILLVDLDLLSPKADLFLNTDKYPGHIEVDAVSGRSGLEIVMDSLEKGYLDCEVLMGACIRKKELKNLYVLTGSYSLENYEYFSIESLEKLIDQAYMFFDLTVLLVNKSVYDAYTVISLIRSDYNLIALRADMDCFREFNRYILFLKEKQHIPENKTKFIAFEYDSAKNLQKGLIEEITEHNFLGSIAYSRKRCEYRNRKISYARRMEKKVLDDYLRLLPSFSITLRETVILKILRRIKGIWVRRDVSHAGSGNPS